MNAAAHIEGCTQSHRARQQCDGPIAEASRMAERVHTTPYGAQDHQDARLESTAPRWDVVVAVIALGILAIHVLWVVVWVVKLANMECPTGDCDGNVGALLMFLLGEFFLVPASIVAAVLLPVSAAARRARSARKQGDGTASPQPTKAAGLAFAATAGFAILSLFALVAWPTTALFIAFLASLPAMTLSALALAAVVMWSTWRSPGA